MYKRGIIFLIGAVAFFEAGHGFLAFAGGKFFPEKTFSKASLAWYEAHLDAMQEDSLWQKSTDPSYNAYRYLLISILEDPIAVKVVINGAKGAHVVITEMKRPPQYGRHYQRGVKELDLTQEQTERFIKIFNEEEFWSTVSKNTAIRFGGIQWVIEGAKDGQYQAIERWSTGEKDFPKAVEYIFELFKE